MAITVGWFHQNQNVILMTLANDWDWNDYLQSQNDMNNLIDRASGIVHHIVDLRTQTELPWRSFYFLPQVLRNNHPNRGKVIYVGANSVIERFYNVIAHGYPILTTDKYHFVKTFDEVEELLNRI